MPNYHQQSTPYPSSGGMPQPPSSTYPVSQYPPAQPTFTPAAVGTAAAVVSAEEKERRKKGVVIYNYEYTETS